MAYFLNDLYTTSGTGKINGCWTANVTKFTSEDFYSWEEDNLPLDDLDERTDFLWEKLGNATSSISPKVILVSSTYIGGSCSSNVFTDLSSVTKALPHVINSPIIIEIASFGNLGNLDLDGLSFGPSGSIEIINRLYYNSKISTVSPLVSVTHVSSGPHGSYGNIIKSVSASWTDGDATPYYINLDGYSPSTLTTGRAIFSSTLAVDSRVNTYLTPIFTYQPFKANPNSAGFSRVSLGFQTGHVDAAIGDKILVSSIPFEETATTEISTYDPSSFNQLTDVEMYTGGSTSTIAVFQGYHNYLQSVNISNCNGPIYLRGFLVEGEGTREVGMQINNSKVYLEDIAIDRFIYKGLAASNSDLYFYRNFIVNRCYGYTNGTRTSTTWRSNITRDDFLVDRSAGMETFNCRVKFDNQVARDYSLRSSVIATNPWYGPFSCNIIFSRNSTGWRADNTNVVCYNGRYSVTTNTAASISALSDIIFEGNANFGLEANNSNFAFDNRVEFINNTRGALINNSKFNVEEFAFTNNHKYGLKLFNSKMLYGYKTLESSVRWDFADMSYFNSVSDPRFSFMFQNNGQHVISIASVIDMLCVSSMPTRYGRFYAVSSVGVDTNGNPEPAFDLRTNSSARFIHTTIESPSQNDSVCRGLGVSLRDGSELTMLGTSSCITTIFPSQDSWSYSQTKNVAGLYANNGSTIKLRGPTAITGFGIDCLAENNSNIVIEPHKTIANTLDSSGFNLTYPSNHTMVELQSTRACIVVDKGSNLVATDLGDYNLAWAGSTAGEEILSAVNYNSSSAGFNTAQYTSAGYLQFYPNPNDAADYGVGAAASNLTTVPTNASVKGSGPYYLLTNYRPANSYDMSAVTNGGMCIRALNNSNILMRNVNFPCGWWNASSLYYDTSASDGVCSRLFIWNITNDSTMKASYLSVSSLYPYDAGYYGPNALWFSGAGAANYGLPITTEDTSSLSILDQFGTSGNSLYGQSSHENQGPFRLYVGVDSVANVLKHSGSLPGPAYQLWSQGYQVSGNLQPIDASLSAVFGKLIRYSGGVATSSGFYYADEMVNCNPNNIMLDESAANTFANAKNGATGSSRKPQICVIYNTSKDYDGEGRSNSTSFIGQGFKSSNIFDIVEES